MSKKKAIRPRAKSSCLACEDSGPWRDCKEWLRAQILKAGKENVKILLVHPRAAREAHVDAVLEVVATVNGRTFRDWWGMRARWAKTGLQNLDGPSTAIRVSELLRWERDYGIRWRAEVDAWKAREAVLEAQSHPSGLGVSELLGKRYPMLLAAGAAAEDFSIEGLNRPKRVALLKEKSYNWISVPTLERWDKQDGGPPRTWSAQVAQTRKAGRRSAAKA